ncbi:MAG: PqqD family protein [Calditrichaeota bacterium]|nr:MAG: PqqD family protein [Calditrichota bacterium]
MVEIIMPKFGKHPIGTWLMKHMQKPTYRLKLDEVGSFVWERCDGTYKVEEIGQLLQEKFGEKVEPVFERLILFFRQLEKIKSIIWV